MEFLRKIKQKRWDLVEDGNHVRYRKESTTVTLF